MVLVISVALGVFRSTLTNASACEHMNLSSISPDGSNKELCPHFADIWALNRIPLLRLLLSIDSTTLDTFKRATNRNKHHARVTLPRTNLILATRIKGSLCQGRSLLYHCESPAVSPALKDWGGMRERWKRKRYAKKDAIAYYTPSPLLPRPPSFLFFFLSFFFYLFFPFLRVVMIQPMCCVWAMPCSS